MNCAQGPQVDAVGSLASAGLMASRVWAEPCQGKRDGVSSAWYTAGPHWWQSPYRASHGGAGGSVDQHTATAWSPSVHTQP